jgi:AP-2 complex subunit alpha
VLFEDDTIQIGVKSEYHGALGRLALFFGNKVSTTISDIKMGIEYPNETTESGVSARFHDEPVGEIGGRAQIQEMIHVECKDVFSDPPVLRMTYEFAGSLRTLVLRLPIFLTRFIEGVTLEAGPFFERWKVIGGESNIPELPSFRWRQAHHRPLGPPREAQKIFPIKLTKTGDVDLAKNSKVMTGTRLSLLPNVDPNPSNVSHRDIQSPQPR